MDRLTPARLLALDARLSEREREIVTTVARLRLVSGRQLERLFFSGGGSRQSNARLARKALSELVSMGLLRRLQRRVGGVRAGSAAFVYETGPAGQRLLAYWRGEGIARTRGAHEPGGAFVAHTLAVAEVYVRLREASRISRLELVSFAAEPDCWREFVGLGGRRLTLKPDIHLRLGLEEFEDSWFVEVDRATESSTVIRRQCEAYLAYWRSGREQAANEVFPRVLWIVPHEKRAQLVEQVIAALPADTHRLFAVATEDEAFAVLVGHQAGGRS
jgi:hypothetical protein